MKTKHALIVLALGFTLSILGVGSKLTHLPWANYLLLISTIVEVTGLVLLVYKLITHPKLKDFLNQ